MIIKLTRNDQNRGRNDLIDIIVGEVRKMSYLFGYDVEVINDGDDEVSGHDRPERTSIRNGRGEGEVLHR